MSFGRRAFFGYVVDPADGTVWFANVPRPPVSRAERDATGAQQGRRQLLELYASDRGPATDLIAAGQLEFAGDNTYDLPQVPTWQRGPMVIIGDAAHAPAPTSGQGASLAAEDAVVLAKCLCHQPDIGQALGVYERLRRPRVERIVAQAARTSSTKTPGLVGRLLRDLMLPVVFRFLSPTGRWRGGTTTTSTGTPRSPSPPSQPDPTLPPATRRLSKGPGMNDHHHQSSEN